MNHNDRVSDKLQMIDRSGVFHISIINGKNLFDVKNRYE